MRHGQQAAAAATERSAVGVDSASRWDRYGTIVNMSRRDRGRSGDGGMVRTAVVAGALLASGGYAVGQEESVGADRSVWKAADPGYALVFPRDHAAHPDHRIEWWYYTGNLRVSDGSRRFGYQLTFFRVGVDRAPVNPSRWAVRDLYMAHFAVTDVESGEHHVAERLNRAGIGWAGASTETLHVWNDGWAVTLDERDRRIQRLAASDDGGLAIDLRLDPAGPPVLHGVNGFSQKGAETGNASHYYSLTRLRTTGRLEVAGESFDVEGLSWMDHEFGTSFLEPAQAGWDWFSIQLDDGDRPDGLRHAPDRRSARPAVERHGGFAGGRDASAGRRLPPGTRPPVDFSGQRRRLSRGVAYRRPAARPGAGGDGGGRRAGTGDRAVHRGHLLGGCDRRAGYA